MSSRGLPAALAAALLANSVVCLGQFLRAGDSEDNVPSARSRSKKASLFQAVEGAEADDSGGQFRKGRAHKKKAGWSDSEAPVAPETEQAPDTARPIASGFGARAQAMAQANLARLAPAEAWAAYSAGNHEKALQLALSAAQGGDAGAAAFVGYIYGAGGQVPEDQDASQKWFKKFYKHCKKLAFDGDPGGEQGLGWIYQNGLGGYDQDYAEAAKWYRQAAEQGDSYAQGGLGFLYHFGSGVRKDYGEAERWSRKSAEQGNPFAQAELGSLYENGLGVAADQAAAYKWYAMAGAQDNDEGRQGMERLRQLMTPEESDGAAKEAVAWYRQAAEQGKPFGLNGLGFFYENGIGVDQSYTEAYKWYSLASARNNAEGLQGMDRIRQLMTTAEIAEAENQAASFQPEAQAAPAQPPLREPDVQRRTYSARALELRKAAEVGDAASQSGLGSLYEKGMGVVKDYVEAYKWYALADEQRNAEGRQGLIRLRQSMTPEDVAQGQKLVSSFKAGIPKPAAEDEGDGDEQGPPPSSGLMFKR